MDDERCTQCNRLATYVAPELFCDEHWLAWWNMGKEDDPMTLDQIKAEEGCPIASQRFEDHTENCEICCTEENDFDYCAIGQSLEETWALTIPED